MSGPKTSYVRVEPQQRAELARQQAAELARRQAEMQERLRIYRQLEQEAIYREGNRRREYLERIRSQLEELDVMIAGIEACRGQSWFSDVVIRAAEPAIHEAEHVRKKIENAPAEKTSAKLARANETLSGQIKRLDQWIPQVRETYEMYSRLTGQAQAERKSGLNARLENSRKRAAGLMEMLRQTGSGNPEAEACLKRLREIDKYWQSTEVSGEETAKGLLQELEREIARAEQFLKVHAQEIARRSAQQMDAGFALSFASRRPVSEPAEPIKETPDARRREQIQDALDELEELNLSGELRTELDALSEEAGQIRNNEYLENFYLAVLLPFIRRCKKEDELRKNYDDLLLKCQALAQACDMELEWPEATSEGIAALDEQFHSLEKADLERREKAYIDQTLDEVMQEMGYELVGDRTVVKKSGQRIRHELYSLNEGTAVDVTYGANGQISMELGGVDTKDREPTAGEASELVEDMRQFCTHYETLARRLARRGIEMRQMQLLPPEAEFAQIINISDYHLRGKGVEEYRVGRQRKAGQQMSRTKEKQ